jgi:hypothetical protein
MSTIVAIAGAKIIDELWGTAAHGVWDRFKTLRMAKAREILLGELRNGKHWAITDDQAVAALFAYARAASEGAARVNLRMIAEALANSAQEPSFAPDEFRRHADSLAGLSRDEILLLASFIRANRHAALQPDEPQDQTRRASMAWASVLKDPDIPPALDTIALAAALGRTGWIAPASSYGGLTYYTTSVFEGVVRLVDFELAMTELDQAE